MWARYVTTTIKGVRTRPWHRLLSPVPASPYVRDSACGLVLTSLYRYNRTRSVETTNVIPLGGESRCRTCARMEA